MGEVTGIGGVFIKSEDPKRLYAWYEKHFGLRSDGSGIMFSARPEEAGTEVQTIFAVFPQTTKYFAPSSASFMLNFRVRDLDGLVAKLEADGATLDPKRDDHEYGKFAWVMDPDGNRIELWEPK
jgi:catechol 2,3-dioxygenase-like lactoylglutathione lyase family enzyme